MTSASGRAFVIVLAAAVLVAAAVLTISRERASSRSAATGNRPTLLLLTGLPLLFNEDFSLKGSDSAALKALRRDYRVVPISTTDASELARGKLLLMAQPQALAPENLVILDQWVRGGGRLMLLADPMLEWPSRLPLGDPTRPPPMFVDTGLLGHWGLRLGAPDKRGPAMRMLGGQRVLTVSPGALYGQCRISGDRLVADCRFGKGEAVVIGDADLLNVGQLGPGARNLDGLLAELARLADS